MKPVQEKSAQQSTNAPDTVSKKIIVVRHHEGDLDDTASKHLAEGNYEVENWYPFKEPENPALPDVSNVAGTIIMGGSQNVTELNDLPYLQTEIDWIHKCIEANLTVVGICLGSQLIAHALGGRVSFHSNNICEFGYEPVHAVNTADNPWITGTLHMMQAHFQGFTLPDDCTCIATGDNFSCQAFTFKNNVFAFQFHPEVHRDMFIEWQNADWKDEFNATPGARPPALQLTENEQYHQAQTLWFKDFLNKILPPVQIDI